MVQTNVGEGAHHQEFEPETHVISDDDGDGDFKDWERDVEMGLFEMGLTEPTVTTRQTNPVQSPGPPPSPPLQVST
ncbi:hypothetical protein NCS56_01515300 [Fusarium sp. Ph1]|nr:hypothetical protein NCS56_01515300 [Fusarium sp. Ph1]